MFKIEEKIKPPLKSLLPFSSKVTFGNTALAIIFLTILSRFVFLPWKLKIARDNKRYLEKLSEIKQTLKELQEKYGITSQKTLVLKDLKQFQAETKILYDNAGVKFQFGLLPSLLENSLAAFIRLAIAYSKSEQYFKSGGILWFRDLSQPDRFLILPILSAGLTYLNQRNQPLPLKESDNQIKQSLNFFLKFSPFLVFIGSSRRASGEVLGEVIFQSCDLIQKNLFDL